MCVVAYIRDLTKISCRHAAKGADLFILLTFQAIVCMSYLPAARSLHPPTHSLTSPLFTPRPLMKLQNFIKLLPSYQLEVIL